MQTGTSETKSRVSEDLVLFIPTQILYPCLQIEVELESSARRLQQCLRQPAVAAKDIECELYGATKISFIRRTVQCLSRFLPRSNRSKATLYPDIGMLGNEVLSIKERDSNTSTLYARLES